MSQENTPVSTGARRTNKRGGLKRKGADDYAAEYPDLQATDDWHGGKPVRVLFCRFCCLGISSRSDRIKEHLSSKRHLRTKKFQDDEAFGENLMTPMTSSEAEGAPNLPSPQTSPLRLVKRRSAAEPLPFQMMGSAGFSPAHNVPTGVPDVLESSSGSSRASFQTSPETSSTNSSPPPPPSCSPARRRIKWNGDISPNILSIFSKLRSQGHFCDVTLWCEGEKFQCHKLVLSAYSSYFMELLLGSAEGPNSVIFLLNMRRWEVESLVEFMYKGEIDVELEKFPDLIIAATTLQIKGLSGLSETTDVDVKERDGRSPTSTSSSSVNDNANLEARKLNKPTERNQYQPGTETAPTYGNGNFPDSPNSQDQHGGISPAVASTNIGFPPPGWQNFISSTLKVPCNKKISLSLIKTGSTSTTDEDSSSIGEHALPPAPALNSASATPPPSTVHSPVVSATATTQSDSDGAEKDDGIEHEDRLGQNTWHRVTDYPAARAAFPDATFLIIKSEPDEPAAFGDALSTSERERHHAEGLQLKDEPQDENELFDNTDGLRDPQDN